MAKKFIVKVQLKLDSINLDYQTRVTCTAIVFNKAKTINMEFTASNELVKKIGSVRKKSFFWATGKADDLQIHQKAPRQNW